MTKLPRPRSASTGWPWGPIKIHALDRRPRPRISIIIPSFEQARYIEATLRSVLLQGYPDLEVIVIDGGSRDGTVDLLREYAPYLAHWESEPDRGQAHALNKALARCTGDIIGWLNSDDIYCPGTLEHVARVFQDDPEAVVVHGDRILLDRDGNVAGWSVAGPFDPSSHGYSICSETAFWLRRKVIDARFDEELRFAMDLDWFARLLRVGRFRKLDRFLGCFRCYAENKSSTMPEVCAQETRMLWARHFGAESRTYEVLAPVPRGRHLLTPLLHPLLIGIPYARRRLLLGRRGVSDGPGPSP